MNDIIEKVTGKKVDKVVKLHGDASYRTYSRAYLSDGTTCIVMQMPKGLSSVSEEITNFNGKHAELPFINVQRFLSEQGLPVPKIFEYDEASRIMVLEDLGDGLMWNFVQEKPSDVQRDYYKKAIDLLARLQNTVSCGEARHCVALERSFDAYLLNWEFDHFREYLIEERSGKKMEAADRDIFEKLTRRITDEILRLPQTFTHRDFQSKNLLVMPDGSLSMIDFQDALKGPYVYDLVALLRDSYVDFEPEFVTEMLEYYRTVSGSRFQVSKDFRLMTLQRKMKDAGRFVYIDRVKKNRSFLQYIPRTLEYVRQAFEPNDQLFQMLKKYVPEWK